VLFRSENEHEVTSGEKPEEVSAVPPAEEAAAPKRGPGTKEVVPLAWKLVGISDGMPVTLLKCIDRAEAEAQLERLQSERYYSELAIYEIDAEVPVPASAVKARDKAIGEAMSEVAIKSERPRTKARSPKAAPAAPVKAKPAAAKIAKAAPTKAKAKSKPKAKAAKVSNRGGATAAKSKPSKKSTKKSKGAAAGAKKKTKAAKSKKAKGGGSAKKARRRR